ncbi:DNA-binding transcriptional regulator, PucR family [Pseudonocardia thermophila]|uniref:DNA-binding transcriptional regulator, PucR family n=1 Tax=Pseudonocardia thermophila TaxID=1848 RepID=A0A1M6RLH8_PSETH|nr:GAF domain-containing protein [Pseudonocardia thermophila]SHK33270.1 DNA-binding transcriptional regulator, PucR family [Pseudonocardia thermophila]
MSLTADTTSGILARVLDLLAREAPPERFAELAREVGPHPLLDQVLTDAARVRTLLEQRARREREAQVLYATARDLTSLRGSDDVLTAIVDRARDLLGCASAYIALIDAETGDAYMRVTSGTRTRALDSVRQPPGYGVGGYVIQTGQPLATANYHADPRIRHDPAVSAAVRADGIVSIAGVPMKLGTRVVGALFAADRYERVFDQAEIALLGSLAAHASVVIENARLFDQIRESSAELRAANVRLRRQQLALERAGRAHELLMPMALTRVGMPEFARTLADVLEGTVVVTVGPAAVLASATAPGAPSPEDLLGGRTGPDVTVRTVPVQAGQETFGQLMFARPGDLGDPEVRTLERAAQTAALLLLMERRTAMVAQELRTELVEDLLATPAPDRAALRRRARLLDAPLDLDRPLAVVVLTAEGVGRSALIDAASDFAAARRGIAAEHDGRIVVLLPDTDPGAAARAAAAELDRATGGAVTAGAAGPAPAPEAVRDAHRDAARCHRLLVALGRRGGVDVAALGVIGMVLEEVTADQVHQLLDRTLGPLLHYDRTHDAHLVRTVECYFACGQNPPTTARHLGVHVNTVYQRLERVDHILGGRAWRDPRGALDVQMALQFHRLVTGDPEHGCPHDTTSRA